MRLLKTLNRINALSLFLYIPYIIIFHNDFFFGKNRGNGIGILSLVLFLTTFFCGFIILITAENKNIENSFSISEALSLEKGKLFTLVGVWAVGIILILLYIHDAASWFYVICSTISLIFVIGEAVVIKKIDVSPYFKISIPWYLYPVPFIFFISAIIFSVNNLDEKYHDAAIIIIFILSGIMLAFLAWHSCYYIDTENKTIEKEHGVLSIFKRNTVIRFDKINLVKKQGMYYIIKTSDEEFKINRLFSSVKRMEQTLYDNGIPIQ